MLLFVVVFEFFTWVLVVLIDLIVVGFVVVLVV